MVSLLYMWHNHTDTQPILFEWIFFYQLFAWQIKPQFWMDSKSVFAKLCVGLRFTYCWWRTEGCNQTCRGEGGRRARKTSGREREREVRCVSQGAQKERQRDGQETEERRQEFMLDGSRHDLHDDTPLIQIECWRLAKQWERCSWEAGQKCMPTFWNIHKDILSVQFCNMTRMSMYFIQVLSIYVNILMKYICLVLFLNYSYL